MKNLQGCFAHWLILREILVCLVFLKPALSLCQGMNAQVEITG